MTTGIHVNDTVVRTDSIIHADAGGETVALNVEKGFCYGLSKIGSRVWALIAEPQRIDCLCTTLVGEYDIDRQTCEQHVLEFLEALQAEGLVELHCAPDAGER